MYLRNVCQIGRIDDYFGFVPSAEICVYMLFIDLCFVDRSVLAEAVGQTIRLFPDSVTRITLSHF